MLLRQTGFPQGPGSFSMLQSLMLPILTLFIYLFLFYLFIFILFSLEISNQTILWVAQQADVMVAE